TPRSQTVCRSERIAGAGDCRGSHSASRTDHDRADRTTAAIGSRSRRAIMKKSFQIFLLTVVFAWSVCGTGLAQQVTVKPPEPDRTLVKVQVVLSRYNGDRKISSLPYTMLATAATNERSQQVSVRTGAQVAVPSTPPPDPKQGLPAPNWQYLNVGTNIDCRVT